MKRLKALLVELRARRRGARYVSRDIRRAARDIVGPTGAMLSNGWEYLARDEEAYLRSFDPRVPPSLHISARDLQRANIPVPLVERCIEDHRRNHDPEAASG